MKLPAPAYRQAGTPPILLGAGRGTFRPKGFEEFQCYSRQILTGH